MFLQICVCLVEKKNHGVWISNNAIKDGFTSSSTKEND